MSRLDVEIAESLKQSIVKAARELGIPLEQLVTLAVAEKISALRTADYLRREGQAGERADFDRFLDAVPPREPSETDRRPG